MILVDTTIIVALMRTADPTLNAALKANNAAICGITRAEVLNGVRVPADRARFTIALDTLTQISIPDALWDEVGLLLAALRSAGFTVPFADAVIAALAIHLDVEVWSRDRHFQMIQTVLPALRLFQLTP